MAVQVSGADTPQTLTSLLAQLHAYADGHIVIVVCARYDQYLERALITKMRPSLSRDFRDRIFGGTRPLGNFAAKIDMAYALEILSKESYDCLRKVNAIRVCFAHSLSLKNFSDPEIASLLKSISDMDDTIPDMKMRLLERMDGIETDVESAIKPAV